MVTTEGSVAREEPRPLALLMLEAPARALFATLPPLGMVHDWLAHQRVHAAGGAELEEALKAAHELVDDLISESFEALRLEKPEVERSANRMVELLNRTLVEISTVRSVVDGASVDFEPWNEKWAHYEALPLEARRFFLSTTLEVLEGEAAKTRDLISKALAFGGEFLDTDSDKLNIGGGVREEPTASVLSFPRSSKLTHVEIAEIARRVAINNPAEVGETVDRLTEDERNSGEFVNDARLVGKVALSAIDADRARDQLATDVHAARAAGVPWTAIGAALNITPQAAYRRFDEEGRAKRDRYQKQRRRSEESES